MMNNGAAQEMRHASMHDLFRSEIRTHTATIQDVLAELPEHPLTADTLDTLLQATYSLKGGAKIVENALAADIAGGLEKCFGMLKKANSMLDEADITVLYGALSLLRDIADVPDGGMAAWHEKHRSRVTQMLDAIRHIVPKEQALPKLTEPLSPPTSESDSDDISEAQSVDIDFSTGIADESMLDLFKTEVETHAAVLTDGLLALEEHPGSVEHLEALMRAAHSIKGGARVVELDAVVQIAHIMEDCFVAAQKSQLLLKSDHIDILLQGVDMLTKIARVPGDGAATWLADHQDDIVHIVSAIQSILTDKPVAPKKVVPSPTPADKGPHTERAQPAADVAPSPPRLLVREQQKAPSSSARGTESDKSSPPVMSAEERDRMIRVTATKIERLMGLGGEVVVSARWLPQFSESLLALKKTHNELFSLLEKLQELLGDDEEFRQMRSLAFQAREKTRECGLSLADRLNQLDMFTSTSANLSDRLYHEVIGVRMRPFADGVQRFPRMVRDLAKQLGKKVKLEIIGKSTDVDRDILEKLDAPLTHLIRNAIDHGIEDPAERVAAGKPESGMLHLEAVHRSGMLMITFSDDGQGIDLSKLRQKILDKGMANATIVDDLSETELMEFLFLPGFSTSETITEISGRGVGLDVVHDMVHEVGGVIRAVSSPGQGTGFHLELPLTLSVIRTFLVEIAGEPYAFPLARIDRCLVIEEEGLESVEDRQYFRFDKTNIALVDIHDILEIEESATHEHGLPVVVISDRSNAYGVLVDTFIGECDLVVRPIDPRLGKVPDISAVAVMLDGAPVLIFDVDDMLRSVDKMVNVRRLRKVTEGLEEAFEAKHIKRILVIDDSITVREMERKILENQGYHVDVAVDGMDGWNAVRTESFDLVVTDIDMPRMNGIELVSNVKQHEELKSLPVIIISYKDTEEHRLQGLDAGANYYLTKSSFQDDSFINAVVDLIGEA